MRAFVLLPIIAITLVASCSVEKTGATRSAPKRDLTLAPQSFESAISSPLEREQPKVLHTAASIARRKAQRVPPFNHIEPTVHLASMTTTIPVAVHVDPVAQPISTPTSSDNSRELLPGKTVTIIPVSNGPSPATDTGDDLPPEGGHTMVRAGGGRCGGGRGHGPGIASAPQPDFR
jgi:hypothetical protein